MIACKRYIVFTLIVLAVFILMSGISFAWEEVENVRIEQVGDDAHIYYDLRGDADKYKVTVRGSSDGGRNYRLPMKTVSGDVGKDIRPRSGKKIIWKALKDAGELEGDEFVFEVEAVSGPGKEFVNSIGMKFVYIKSGDFMMGSPSNEPKRDSDEKQHRVTLTKGFYMGATEVTQGQWKKIMGNNPSRFKGDNLPVEIVSWNDCREFIRKLNRQEGGNKYRLPTEAEWEYACRAGSKTRFCFGDSDSRLGDYDWYRSNSSSKTHSVARKKPNAWGLYDMHGNVCEWCEDWKGDYPSGHVTDPEGPSDGSYWVFRGGCWSSGAGGCRSADRGDYFLPSFRRSYLGFRLARTP